MPAAAVTAGAGLVGGIINSKQAGKASRYQYDAQREALQYQRDRDAAARADRDQAYQRYKDDYDAWLFRNYGVRGKGMSGSNQFKPGGGGATAQTPIPGAPTPGGQTLGDIAYNPNPVLTPAGPPMVPGGGTVKDMADRPGEWNDWRNYGTA